MVFMYQVNMNAKDRDILYKPDAAQDAVPYCVNQIRSEMHGLL